MTRATINNFALPSSAASNLRCDVLRHVLRHVLHRVLHGLVPNMPVFHVSPKGRRGLGFAADR